MGETKPATFMQPESRVMGIRLTVFLPILLVMLTFAVGLWTIYLTTGSLGLAYATPRAVIDIQAVRRAIFLVVGVGGGLALLLGIALAYSINREWVSSRAAGAPGQGDQK